MIINRYSELDTPETVTATIGMNESKTVTWATRHAGIQTSRSTFFRVQTSMFAPPCWQVLNQSGQIDPGQSLEQSLQISGYCLQPGQTYTGTVTYTQQFGTDESKITADHQRLVWETNVIVRVEPRCEDWTLRPDLKVGDVYGYVKGVGANAQVVAKLNGLVVGCQTTRDGGLLPYMPLYHLFGQSEGNYEFFVDGVKFYPSQEITIGNLEAQQTMIDLLQTMPQPTPVPTVAPLSYLKLVLVTHGQILERPDYFSISVSTFGEPMEYFFHGEGEKSPIVFTESTIIDFVRQIDLPSGWEEESLVCTENGVVITTMPYILADGKSLSCVATNKKLAPTETAEPTGTATPTPTTTQTPEPTETAVTSPTPSPTPSIVPTAAPTLASAFTMTVPSSVNAGEVFTVSGHLDLREAITGEAQILISFSGEITPITPTITVSGSVSFEELGITVEYLSGQFPHFQCGQPQAAQVQSSTVLAVHIANASLLQPGSQITVTAPFKAVSSSGVIPSSPLWVDGAFLGNGVAGNCIMLVQQSKEILAIDPNALTQLIFLPLINR